MDTKRLRHALQCVAALGEYVECLGPVLQEAGVEASVALLRRYGSDASLAGDVLRCVCALLAHRRCVNLPVDWIRLCWRRNAECCLIAGFVCAAGAPQVR